MTDGKGKGGLVKNLLFPAYTTAGSNDAFRAVPRDLADEVVEQHNERDPTVISDATTALHGNLFKPINSGEDRGENRPTASVHRMSVASPPRPSQPMEADGGPSARQRGTGGRDAASSSLQQHPPPFFPSTTPHAFERRGHNPPPQKYPLSPPSISRRRSTLLPPITSLPAEKGGGVRAGRKSMGPGIQVGASRSIIDQVNDGDEKKQEQEETTSQHVEGTGEMHGPIKQEDLDKIDKAWVESNNGNTREFGMNNPYFHNAHLYGYGDKSGNGNDNGDLSSEVNSNVSEFGTVIESGDRLADVQAMIAASRKVVPGDAITSPISPPRPNKAERNISTELAFEDRLAEVQAMVAASRRLVDINSPSSSIDTSSTLSPQRPIGAPSKKTESPSPGENKSDKHTTSPSKPRQMGDGASPPVEDRFIDIKSMTASPGRRGEPFNHPQQLRSLRTIHGVEMKTKLLPRSPKFRSSPPNGNSPPSSNSSDKDKLSKVQAMVAASQRLVEGNSPKSQPSLDNKTDLISPKNDQEQAGDVSSDISSTASQMGTVVGTGDRLADVEAMVAVSRRIFGDKSNSRPQSGEGMKADNKDIFREQEAYSGANNEKESSGESIIPKEEEYSRGEDIEQTVDNDVSSKQNFKLDDEHEVQGHEEYLSLPVLDQQVAGDKKNLTFRQSALQPPHRQRELSDDNLGSHVQDRNDVDHVVETAPERISSKIRKLSKSVKHLTKASKSSGTSAPNTPPKVLSSNAVVDDIFTSTVPPPDSSIKTRSFLLRSPGSSAHFMADRRRTRGELSTVGTWDGTTPKASGNGGANGRDVWPRVNPLQRLARGCFSYDTSVDEYYDYRESHNGHREFLREPLDARQSKRQPKTQLLYETSRSWDVGSAFSNNALTLDASENTRKWNNRSSAFEQEKSSQSPSSSRSASAFRSAPYTRRRPRESQHRRPLRNFSEERRDKINLMKDGATSFNKSSAVELQTPQRIEIEREDALDILACLVERGVSFSRGGEGMPLGITNKDEIEKESGKDQPLGKNGEDQPDENSEGKGKMEGNQPAKTTDVTTAVDALRELSERYSRGDRGSLVAGETDHDARMQAIDVLLRAHSHSMEMKRASLSASTWLRSIGREAGEIAEEELEHQQQQLREVLAPDTKCDKVKGEEASGENASCELNDEAFNSNDNSKPAGAASQEKCEASNSVGKSKAIDDMELVTLKAMLHSAQIEAKEKGELSNRLNEELSKCRAEIGRLRSASRAESMFQSPNRSILDDKDDEESTSSLSRIGKNDGGNGLGKSSPIPRTGDGGEILDVDSSLFRGVDSNTDEAAPALSSNNLALSMLKGALLEANKVIRNLHVKLKESNPGSEHFEEPPIIRIPEIDGRNLVDGMSDRSESLDDIDYKTVNVRMLDGENFITEWDAITPPLPPPPDHGLRSPIVGTVLQQWTSERGLHESLMSWMDKIMSGGDPASIPPLTLSSLDHQVRDGFIMHVLPLLLRRSDIHVDVKTRAHRRTVYDLAVSVKGVPKISQGIHRHLESIPAAGVGDFRNTEPHSHEVKSMVPSDFAVVESTTHSTATGHIRNASGPTMRSPLRNGDTMGVHAGVYMNGNGIGGIMQKMSSDEASVGSTPNTGSVQPGLMSALGGALGGLLSRRGKPSSINQETPSREFGGGKGYTMSPSFNSHHYGDGGDEDREQPYHRVVSAPPGRIGVTFVEFRGHAMVSDVARDSPLSGWVFPSDILIALDEVPVSGMRVRDIIKLLTARKGRQRALRVISSHDMNEFTLTTSNSQDAG